MVFGSWGSGKVKIWLRLGLVDLQNFWLWSPLEAPKLVKDPGKKLKSIGEIVWGPFLVSLGHSGGSIRLRGQ